MESSQASLIPVRDLRPELVTAELASHSLIKKHRKENSPATKPDQLTIHCSQCDSCCISIFAGENWVDSDVQDHTNA
jgi:hypothetical protein